MKEYRRVPQSMLRKRLQVEPYDVETPFETAEPKPAGAHQAAPARGQAGHACIAEGAK